MEFSIFIARVAAVIYLSIGIGLFIDGDYYKKSFDKMLGDPGTMYLGGFIALIIGFLIVSLHNHWVKDWRVLVTLIGWIGLIKGVALLAVPGPMLDFSRKLIKGMNMNFIAVFAITFGAVLGYFGFMV